jgi:GT2 family glycosyltransferase
MPVRNEMSKIAVIISPNFKDYAKRYLDDCLNSVRRSDCYGDCGLFLVDNASTETSFDYLKSKAPEAKILRNLDNAGFAKGNNVAISLALEQGYDLVVLLNMDTIVKPDAISEMIRLAQTDASIGAIQARLMLWPDQDKINSLGNCSHFLGFGFCDHYGDRYDDLASSQGVNRDIFYPSGAAVLIRADALKRIGLFDEEFWMYAEDQDLGWRVWLSGLRCVLAHEAVVYHKYEFSRSMQKYYWMDRNRLLVIFKNYRIGTLLLIAPALLVMEFGMLYFSISNGSFKHRVEVLRYFSRLSTWRYLARARQEVAAVRRADDKSIVPLLRSTIAYQEIDSAALRYANVFFDAYWSVVKRLIFW